MTRPFQRRAIALAIASLASAGALANPPAGSPYFTDAQQSQVFDETGRAVQFVNMLTCIVDQLNADELVNQPTYAAMVNMTRCEDRGNRESAGSGEAGAATEYMRGLVRSTRAAGEPMRVRTWFEEDRGGDIWVNIGVSAPPGPGNPYGEFRIDWAGLGQPGGAPAPVKTMEGWLAAESSGMRVVEREMDDESGQWNSKRIFLTRAGDSAGAGAAAIVEQQQGGGASERTFQFAFNGTHFLRRSGASGSSVDACFDRRLSASSQSVWRYGVYNEDGTPLARNGGFPITYSVGGATYQGFAGYWGIDLPEIAMASLATGATVTRSGSPDTYTVVRARGKLVRYTRHSATLGAFSGNRFSTRAFNGLADATIAAVNSGLGLSGMDAYDSSRIRNAELEMKWDQATREFKITGVRGSNGYVRAIDPSPALLAEDIDRYTTSGLHGHSMSYGGPVEISGATLAQIRAGVYTGSIGYRASQVVQPGSSGAPATLHCVSNCPSAADMQGYFAESRSVSSPFGATANRFAPTASTVTYTFDGASGLLATGGEPAVIPAGLSRDDMGDFRWGVRSGRMVSELGDLACGTGLYCDSRANDAAVYYQWETGPERHNQLQALRGPGGAIVAFDAPLNLSYTVPLDPSFGDYSGRTVVLQYAGAGQLWGVPGVCIDERTNDVVACGPGKRYVSAFAIPYESAPATSGRNSVRDDSGNRYYVKWLEREVRFARVAAGACAPLVPQLGSLASLPALGGFVDPSSSASANYLGPKPTVTDAPRVIDGVTTR